MVQSRFFPSAQSGFSMVEVLVSLMIILLGLMGLAGMLARMQQSEFESYQRAQALVLLHDMVERIQLHRVTAACFQFTNPAVGAPFLGMGSAGAPACAAAGSSNDNTQADLALAEWHALLRGSAETKGGVAAGAMVGARGCASYNAASELGNPPGTPIPGTGIYTVAVAWQGTSDTFAPVVNCANGLYGTPATADTRRRLVFTTFRLAFLR